MTPSDDPARTRLAAALEAHETAGEEEARHVASTLALVRGAGDCFSRARYEPGHVTGSAFVVHPPTRRLLLLRHRRLQRWLQMGGHDEGEHDAARTALREAAEESGLPDLAFLTPRILDVDVHLVPARRNEPAHLHFDVRYAISTASPDRIQASPEESEDLAWFSLDGAEQLMGEAGAGRAILRISRLLGPA